jgi:hypothetical protein
MAVCVVGSPKFHSCGAAAFLSESINRVTITGINLRRGSDLIVSEENRYPDIHDVSPIGRGGIRWTDGRNTGWNHLQAGD